MIACVHKRTFNLPPPIVAVITVLVLSSAVPTIASSEETLAINALSNSPSSPRQWVLSGAESVPGAAGPEIMLLTNSASTSQAGVTVDPDLYLSFNGQKPIDETGRWTVQTIGTYESSAIARFGDASGSFRAPSSRLLLQPASTDVFTPNLPLSDLSFEFWLKPTRAESGEIVFLWKANRKTASTSQSQQISCLVLRNRVVFSFLNFFGGTTGVSTSINLHGSSILVPGAWSHHLVRFDAATGLLEYVMNGKIEAVTYATSTSKQSGTVYNPVPGGSGRLELASNYTGLLDEFRITQAFIAEPVLRKYPASGAVVISPIFDLGSTNSTLLSIDAQLRTPGEAAVHCSYRAGDSSAGWREDTPPWVPFTAGVDFASVGPAPRGRYIQLRMELYPDASGERSPIVSTLRINYEPDQPPNPPTSLFLAPGNGRIVVSWPPVSEADIAGYVVYYGLSAGDYFGTGALEGASPIFVEGSKTANLSLNGLKNGTLYFIAVAAYDDANPPHIGASSREYSARPSRVAP